VLETDCGQPLPHKLQKFVMEKSTSRGIIDYFIKSIILLAIRNMSVMIREILLFVN
jgi:hypothetical protein